MGKHNDDLRDAITRAQQLKNQASARKRREQVAAEKAATRRYITIGKLVCDHFPEAMLHSPSSSNKDAEQDFRSVENAIKWLADHRELLSRLMQESSDKD